MNLLRQRGYDSIRLADIAAEAGVGRTAVYNHFPDKEAVLLAMAQDHTEEYLGRLREALAGQDDPIDQLRTFLRMQMVELAGHHTRLAGIGTALSIQGRTSIRDHVGPLMEILRDILTSAHATGSIPAQDVDIVAKMISAITAARFTVGLVGDELDRVVGATTTFVLRAIGYTDAQETIAQ